MNIKKRLICILVLVLLGAGANVLGEDCIYGYVDGVEDCGGGIWTFSACSEYDPVTGSYTVRIYDDGCAYVVTA